MSKAKILTALVSSNVRGIVTEANNHNVQREDIVSVLKEGDQFILLCYM